MRMRKMNVWLVIFVTVVAFGSVSPSFAQDAQKDETVEALKNEIAVRTKALSELGKKIKAANDELESIKKSSSDAAKSYFLSLNNYYKYDMEMRNYSIKILNWQVVSVYSILSAVIVVVALGVVLSFIEVRAALQLPGKVMSSNFILERGRKAPASGEDAGDGQGEAEPEGEGSNGAATYATNLEISPQKLQITSAVTGVVVLVISLAFLYIFVLKVLEINPMDLQKPGKTSSAVAAQMDKPVAPQE